MLSGLTVKRSELQGTELRDNTSLCLEVVLKLFQNLVLGSNRGYHDVESAAVLNRAAVEKVGIAGSPDVDAAQAGNVPAQGHGTAGIEIDRADLKQHLLVEGAHRAAGNDMEQVRGHDMAGYHHVLFRHQSDVALRAERATGLTNKQAAQCRSKGQSGRRPPAPGIVQDKPLLAVDGNRAADGVHQLNTRT